MKSKVLTSLSVFVAITFMVFSSVQADPSAPQQIQIDALKKTYPLTTCPVTDDKLESNDMGEKPVDYLYTQTTADGTKTTRLVRFCCKDCLVKFKKNPDEYLKIIDAAAAKKPSAPVSTDSGTK